MPTFGLSCFGASERSERATRTERAGEAARERACRGVRGAKPLGWCRSAPGGTLERLHAEILRACRWRLPS